MNKLAWLRLSDFHFKADGDLFSQDLMCRALTEDVKSRLSEHGGLTFVLVSGDIAFSGKADEYAQAHTFFHQLAAKLSVDAERFFFVPGNHDVDRSLHDLAWQVQVLASEQDIDRARAIPTGCVTFSSDRVPTESSSPPSAQTRPVSEPLMASATWPRSTSTASRLPS